MALFSNDTRVVDTSSPTNFVVGASEPNVGQYGWTKTEVAHYNQLIQYVEEVRKSVEYIRGLSSYIDETLKKLEGIEGLYEAMLQLKQDVSDMKDAFEAGMGEFRNMLIDFEVKLQAFEVKYADFLAKYAEVLAKAAEAKASADAAKVSETNSKNSANDSKNSADEAAKSAQEAADLVARGQIYRGTWKVTPTTTAYPDHKNTNSAWDVILDPADEDTGVMFDGKKWYAGDRLLYIVDSKLYEQVVSGTNVKSINGKAGAVVLTYGDVQAAPEGYGLGENGTRIPGEHCDNAVKNGFYAIYSGTEGTPDLSGRGPSGSRMLVTAWSSSHVTQMFFRVNSTRMYLRSRVVDKEDPSGYSWTYWEEVYSTANKPKASDVGAVSKTGDTMTGHLYLENDADIYLRGRGSNNPIIWFQDADDGNKQIGAVYQNRADRAMVINAYNSDGTYTSLRMIGSGNTLQYRDTKGVLFDLYHAGNKPTADDIGAVKKSGDTMTGTLRIRSNSSQVDLIEADQADKTWRLEVQNKSFQVTEVGAAVRLALAEGGGMTVSGEIKNSGEIKSKSSNSYRMSDGTIGTFWRKDSESLYLMRTEEGQAESGTWTAHRPLSVNLKTAQVTVGNGLAVKDDLTLGGKLRLNTQYVMGYKDNILFRDHGNGNVTISASKNPDGVAGELYLGFNGTSSGTDGYNTKNVRLESRMNWKAGHTIVDADGKMDSSNFSGPIRVEKDAGGVTHTIIGGADTINRGRTIIAGGECGKQLYDNTPTSSEIVHIGGDQNDGVYIHTGLQNGWGSSTHNKYKFQSGDIYVGDGTKRVYHTGYKPSAVDVGALPKTGGIIEGALTVRDQIIVGTGEYKARIVESSGRMHYQGGKGDGDETDQKMILSGYLGKGLTDFQLAMKSDTSPTVKWGNTLHKIYHEGFKPAGSLAQGDFGIGGRQGATADAVDYTEDGTRDFNKLIVAGEYSITGDWLNGRDNKPAAQSHTGMVKVEVRKWDTCGYVQTYTWTGPESVARKMRYGNGTYPNITWSPWRAFGSYEADFEYRMCVSRPGEGYYPYISLTKKDKKTTATSGYYVAGAINFRETPTDANNPDSGRLIFTQQGQTMFDQSANRGVIQLRKASDGSVASEFVLYESDARMMASAKAATWNGTDFRLDGKKVYHEGYKPTLTAADVGAVPVTDGTMSGKLLAKEVEATLKHRNGYMIMKPYGSTYDDGAFIRAYYRGHDNGNPGVGWRGIQWDAYNPDTTKSETFDMKLGTNYVYHQGRKPTAADMNVVSKLGDTMTGPLDLNITQHAAITMNSSLDSGTYIAGQTKGASSWSVGCVNNAGDVMLTNDKHNTHITLKSDGVVFDKAIKAEVDKGIVFPSATYTTGAKIYAREADQYGVNMFITSGGNMVIGGGESAPNLHSLTGGESTYITTDANINFISNANTWADRKTAVLDNAGTLTLNKDATGARLCMGNTTNYIARSGANMHIAANDTNGKVYIEGKTNPMARVNGTDYTLYHAGNKPTAADVGALPLTGGRLTGTLEVAPAQGQNGLNILQTPNTGSNAIGIHGYTSNGSAIQWGCGMLYNGGNPTHAYYGTGASPWANGLKVYPDQVETQGNFAAGGAINSVGTITTASIFRVNKPEWPSIELHRAGSYACLATVDGAGNYVVGGSNGSGSLGASWMTMGGAEVTFNGKVRTLYGALRSWVGQGVASFVGPEIAVGVGNLVATSSQKVHASGIAALEYGRGYYIETDNVNNWAHTFFANDGASFNRYWLFRNNGGQQSPSNFKISPDGHMSGNAYEGYDDHFHWSIANLGAVTDERMIHSLGRSTQSALDVVDQLSINKLVWNEEAGAVHTTRDVKVTEFGLIAQEVEGVNPSLVKTIRVAGENPTETKTLDVAAMLALTLKANQELLARIEALEAKLS